MKSIKLMASLVGIVLLVIIVALSCSSPVTERDANALINRTAPEFAGTSSLGAPVSLRDYRGSWVLVNFFAVYCIPCRIELPELAAWEERHRAAGDVHVVAVAYERTETADQINAMMSPAGADWPVVMGVSDSTALDYGVVKLPESYLVDPQGVVRSKLVGGVTLAMLEQTLADARAQGS